MASSGYREKCLREKGRECESCGESKQVVVHHIDGDRNNNDIDNLAPLCPTHHAEVHNGQSIGLGYVGELPSDAERNYVNITLRLSESTVRQAEEVANSKGTHRTGLLRDIIVREFDPEIENRETELKDMKIDELERQLERSESLVDTLLGKI